MLGDRLRLTVAMQTAEPHQVALRPVGIRLQHQMAVGRDIDAAWLKRMRHSLRPRRCKVLME